MANNNEEKIMPVGGQAVIEGVMMRSPKRIATAIRRASGVIEVKSQEFQSLAQRYKIFNIPIFRGAVTLFEVMIVGIKTLQWSADKAMEDEEEKEIAEGKKEKKSDKKAGMSTLGAIVTIGVALLIGIGAFMGLPLLLATYVFDIEAQPLAFNFVAGIIRILLFLAYVWGISFMKDVKRLFQYHGAEHKTVFAFEDQKFTTSHPRCGTSFLVIVLLISIFFFSLVDALVIMWLGKIDIFIRLATHLPLVPFVAGLSYEALKASAKKVDNPIVQALIFPGLALQRITTQEPDDDQLEVAIVALQTALGEDLKDELIDTPEVKSEVLAVTA